MPIEAEQNNEKVRCIYLFNILLLPEHLFLNESMVNIMKRRVGLYTR